MDKEAYVHLFHIIIIGSLSLYVGISRDNTIPILYPILLGLGIIIIFYHIYKTYKYMKDGKGYWINLIHILFIGPLLIYIGYNKEKTSRKFFEMLLLFGFSAIGYHGYYLFN